MGICYTNRIPKQIYQVFFLCEWETEIYRSIKTTIKLRKCQLCRLNECSDEPKIDFPEEKCAAQWKVTADIGRLNRMTTRQKQKKHVLPEEIKKYRSISFIIKYKNV